MATISFVHTGMQDDDGPGTQFVLVLDEDHRFLASQQGLSGFSPQSFPVASAGPRGVNERGLHREGIIGQELLVRIELLRQVKNTYLVACFLPQTRPW